MRIGIHLDPTPRLSANPATRMVASAAEQMGYATVWIGVTEADATTALDMVRTAAAATTVVQLGLAADEGTSLDRIADRVHDLGGLCSSRVLRLAAAEPAGLDLHVRAQRLRTLRVPSMSDTTTRVGGEDPDILVIRLELPDLVVDDRCVDLVVRDVETAQQRGASEVVLRLVQDACVDQLLDLWARITDAVADRVGVDR
jgi:hypothetical protein